MKRFHATAVFTALATLVLTIFSVTSSSQTPTPACTPSWASGPNVPSVALIRSVGVYFPTNGRFYSIGGRTSDTAGDDTVSPFEYNPTTNTWATKAATYPDNQVNNMACAVLTVSGTPRVYCVGGSAAGQTVATARVFSYDPVTDTTSTLAAGDNWPGNAPGNILPGGFGVVENKLYVIGGFVISGAMISQTWQFDPTAAVGSKWVQKADMPAERGYMPAVAIGTNIYTAGGTAWNGTTLEDTFGAFKYDTVANTWAFLADIPRATGETRAITIGGEVWVLGGGRTSPNPSNEVDIYNPITNTWRLGSPFVSARRNFPADTDGSRIWIAGGYDATGSNPQNTMEIFNASGLCATPTPTPATPGPTPTPVTPGPTRTPTPTPTISPGITPTPMTPTPTPSPTPTPPFDFDGDHKTDISIWRASAGQWWLYRSMAGIVGINFGVSTDIPRAADYTGDGKTDVALYRPFTSEWLILRSENFTYYSFPFGSAGDVPVPGDYDGDGRTDAAVYRPSLQLWFILRSSGGLSIIPFGLSDDIKVPADYDGDGKTDIAIYRPSVGQWWYIRSRDGQVVAVTFGTSTDKPVPGDYMGDGKADIAFWRPSTGEWFILRSEDSTYYAFPWGTNGDRPAPGDYDGDGKFDAAVFRPSDGTWYILRSSGGVSFVPFGLSGDTPVPGQSIP